MVTYFPKALAYLTHIDINTADPLDKIANELLADETKYERASQALRRRFSRGATEVEGVDRESRPTTITRHGENGKYEYQIRGINGEWFTPDERIWVVAMYALWQSKRNKF